MLYLVLTRVARRIPLRPAAHLLAKRFTGEAFDETAAYAVSVALAVIVIPVVVRTTEDMLMLVPDSLREAAASIGLPRAHMIVRIAYRAARAGIVTGILLAVARISGETAPLLFTALNNQFFSVNMNQPMPSLPVVIFQFALSPYKDWQKLAWTGALIITFDESEASDTRGCCDNSAGGRIATVVLSPAVTAPGSHTVTIRASTTSATFVATRSRRTGSCGR